MYKIIHRSLYKVMRYIILKTHISGRKNIKESIPAIFVANHEGAFGPISVMTALPLKIYPWVAHEVMEKKSVSARIQKEFFEDALHLKPPLSSFLSRVLGQLCIAFMKNINAIPVYHNSKRIQITIAESLNLLLNGESILIFAEDSKKILNEAIYEFCSGFIHIAKLYYERTGKSLTFMPVAVNQNVAGVRIGEPIHFNPLVPFKEEKIRMKKELEQQVYEMYKEINT
jgi:1-acyl-sn-glycerol-3-phosphate acyltransferase